MISPVSTQPVMPEPERTAAGGRSGHGFYEVFSGVHEHRSGAGDGAAPASTPPESLATPVEINGAAVMSPHHGPIPAAPASGHSAGASNANLDTSWLYPSQPVSLEPLFEAMRKAGLDPAAFRFEQMEAFVPFPTRPELSYTTRQLVIHGTGKSDMFDRDLVLKTPWVTATEIKTLGIA